MPPGDLAFQVDASFADMGSCTMPKDELTEKIHGGYELLVGRNRSARAWEKGIQMASVMLQFQTFGRRLGAYSGKDKPPTGTFTADPRIASAVENRLTRDFQEDQWKDRAGEWHDYTSDNIGVNGLIPEHGEDGQRVGRAILRNDVDAVVFNSSGASSVSRKNPIKAELTALGGVKRRLVRKGQTNARDKDQILKMNYKKQEMVDDLDAYANRTDIPPKIKHALSGEDASAKETYTGNMKNTRPELAKSLAKWRQEAPGLCSDVHKNEKPRCGDDLRHLVDEEPTTISRRNKARLSLRSKGKHAGFEMIEPSECRFPTSPSENPAVCLLKELDKGSRMKSLVGGQASAKALASKLSSRLMSGEKPDINWNFEASSKVSKGSNEPQIIRDIAKTLTEYAPGAAKDSGRREQMQAARTVIRTAEIEAFMNERIEREAANNTNSPWNSPSKEPPAASIGNAVKWNPPPKVAAIATETGAKSTSSPCPLHNSAGGGVSKRRQQICACCSQPRVRGHVKVCTHVNKVCAKCIKAASQDARQVLSA